MIRITITTASTALLLLMGATFAGPSTSATTTYHTAAVDGVKITDEPYSLGPGGSRIAFVEDPFGTLIELVEKR